MITPENISTILQHAALLKDDHAKVYNYNDLYIIKVVQNASAAQLFLAEQKRFLMDMREHGVSINNLVDYFESGETTYAIYDFVHEQSDTYDFKKIGENLKKMHDLSRTQTYNFPQIVCPDLNTSLLSTIVSAKQYQNICSIAHEIQEEYKKIAEAAVCDVIVHYQLILNNIIKPYTLIDTEGLSRWVVQNDLGSIARLGYRNHQYKYMEEILSWYGSEFTIEQLRIYIYIKDIAVLNRLINNHKNIPERREEIQKRVEHFFDFDIPRKVF